MNWHELHDLVTHLPEESATKAALAGDVDQRRWTQTDYGVSAMYNALLVVIRILWTAHLKGSPPEMKPIEPPRTDADEQAAEQKAAKARRNRHLLEQMRPRSSKTQQEQQAEASQWLAKVRALETARQR